MKTYGWSLGFLPWCLAASHPNLRTWVKTVETIYLFLCCSPISFIIFVCHDFQGLWERAVDRKLNELVVGLPHFVVLTKWLDSKYTCKNTYVTFAIYPKTLVDCSRLRNQSHFYAFAPARLSAWNHTFWMTEMYVAINRLSSSHLGCLVVGLIFHLAKTKYSYLFSLTTSALFTLVCTDRVYILYSEAE